MFSTQELLQIISVKNTLTELYHVMTQEGSSRDTSEGMRTVPQLTNP